MRIFFKKKCLKTFGIIPWLPKRTFIHTGCFFYCSVLKMTKCQPDREISELFLPKKRLRMKKKLKKLKSCPNHVWAIIIDWSALSTWNKHFWTAFDTEHLVNLLKKSQLLRSITRGVGLLELHFGERNSSEQLWYINSLFLLVFGGGTVLRFPYRAGT